MDKSLYDFDYYKWSQEQSQYLKEKRFELLDLENLAEEIESLGKSDKRKIESLLLRLLEHKLKRKYTGIQECYRGWDIEIRNFSNQIKRLLRDSPSLKNYLLEIAPDCYLEAIQNVTEDYDICDFSGGLDIKIIVKNLTDISR